MLKVHRRVKKVIVPLCCAVALLGLCLSMMLPYRTAEARNEQRFNQSLSAKLPSAPNSTGHEPIVPISATLDIDPRKTALGNQLFHETHLSVITKFPVLAVINKNQAVRMADPFPWDLKGSSQRLMHRPFGTVA